MSENYGTNVPLKTDPARVVEVKMLNALNSGAGGGGSGSSAFYNGSGPPPSAPAAGVYLNIVVDANGRQWQYWGGAWH